MLIHTTLLFEDEYVRVTKALYRRGALMPAHQHEHTAISVVLQGVLHETAEGSTQVGQSTQTIIKPAGLVHANLYAEDCSILCLYLKDGVERRLKETRLLHEWSWTSGRSALPLLTAFLAQPRPAHLRDSLNQLLAALAATQAAAPPVEPPAWLQDVKACLDHCYAEPVSVQALARRQGVHPVYLARVFQRYFGQSIKAYLKLLRTHHAAAALCLHGQPARAAAETGFADQSHLTRSFRETLQITPGAFRNLVAG